MVAEDKLSAASHDDNSLSLRMDDLSAAANEPASERDLKLVHAQIDRILSTLRGTLSHSAEASSQTIEAVEAGLLQKLETSNLQLLRLCESFSELMAKQTASEARLSELSVQVELHAKDAHTDALTNVANRRAFDIEMTRQVHDANQTGFPVSLILIDVDHFKRFNDSFGHRAGDAALRGVGQLLRQTMRTRDLVARYGGEEFVVVLPGVRVEEAVLAAERFRRRVEQTPFRCDEISANLSVSCGAAQLLSGEHPGYFVQRADVALYGAKQNGRNCTYWHEGKQLKRATPRDRQSGEEILATELSVNRSTTIEKHAAKGRFMRRAYDSGPRGLGRTNWCECTTFFWWVRQRLAERRYSGTPLSVALIEIDAFEDVLRNHGEPAAELLLRTHRYLLDAKLRSGDVVTEYRGSCVAVAMPNIGTDEATAVLNRLHRESSEVCLPTSRGMLEYTLRSGLSEAVDSDDAASLLARAEEALRQEHSGLLVG